MQGKELLHNVKGYLVGVFSLGKQSLDVKMNYIIKILITELRKVTIISDSMAKYVSGIEGCIVQAFRGDTIARLTQRLQRQEAELEKFQYVIFHVGTNDIGNRASKREMLSDFGNLIGVCRKIKPSINICISAIIPRPIDHSVTDLVISEVNSYLNKEMSKDMQFKFLCTYKPFTLFFFVIGFCCLFLFFCFGRWVGPSLVKSMFDYYL